MKKFDSENIKLCTQFDNINWFSGLDESELFSEYEKLMENKEGFSKAILKAKTFELICKKSCIAIDKDDIFQDKLYGGNLMNKQRDVWHDAVIDKYLKAETCKKDFASSIGVYYANADFGHTSPNSRLLLETGFTGLLKRVEKYSQEPDLKEEQIDFYNSCKIAINGMITATLRLSDAIKRYNEENSKALLNIAKGAPQNIYEAMQLIIIYFFLHQYVGATGVRTLGRLDVLLYPFYKKDIENGTYTKEEIKEMLKFFLNKFWTAKVPFDLPFCLGGIDRNGNEVTNEISYLIVETYNELNIHSPKIHIRVSDKTPESFVKLVLSCIRGGNSSFVFVNDNIGIRSLVQVGIEEEDSKDYVPIGCYEPAVWGVEIGCTGNGGVNLAKAVELVVTNGKDLKTGEKIGVETGKITSYEEFISAIKEQIAFFTQKATSYITKIEKHYKDINPDPILSCQYDKSVETGVDVYKGGAKYNNSSLYFYCIASLVDSICAVKKLVFDEKMLTFDEFCDILKSNWENNENLRYTALNLPEKYGNNNELADSIAKEISDFVAGLVNNKPNGRGGVFKAALFSIDYCFRLGKNTMATPDGRFAGEPLSKNLCATTAMDKNGITALINSVTKIDHSKFPTGSVLDIVLHPSAVSGDDGLSAFYGILMTYIKKGGFAIHGNVFNPDDLIAAQNNPEKYKNLQVRVCGWNAYFVNLSKEEQDAFIKQAKNSY